MSNSESARAVERKSTREVILDMLKAMMQNPRSEQHAKLFGNDDSTTTNYTDALMEHTVHAHGYATEAFPISVQGGDASATQLDAHFAMSTFPNLECTWDEKNFILACDARSKQSVPNELQPQPEKKGASYTREDVYMSILLLSATNTERELYDKLALRYPNADEVKSIAVLGKNLELIRRYARKAYALNKAHAAEELIVHWFSKEHYFDWSEAQRVQILHAGQVLEQRTRTAMEEDNVRAKRAKLSPTTTTEESSSQGRLARIRKWFTNES